MQLQVSHCILLLSVFYTALKKFQVSSPERGQNLCCFLHGCRGNHLALRRLYPFFCLILYLDEQPNVYCLLVWGDSYAGWVPSLSPSEITWRKHVSMSVFGIYSMKKNLFALIWSGYTALAGSEEAEYLWTRRITQKYEVTVKHLILWGFRSVVGHFLYCSAIKLNALS